MPTLNLTHYSGIDLYNDGDIEEELREIVSNNSSFASILASDCRWPILYHLSPIRLNLLEWYEFKKDSVMLEIGAGCGAMTGLFCEKVTHVTTAELSKRRAEIIAQRHHDKENLDIWVGNIMDMTFERKFDYITLIGVLEYASTFTTSKEPYADLLLHAKSFLKEGGILIIALENKFGLKYWAGAKEDHTGRLFDSIEGYPNQTGPMTFGKKEITTLLTAASFKNIKFFYPMPDYKLPNHIFSDEYLPYMGNLENAKNYDRDRFSFFSERLAFHNILKHEDFGFFANSFLIMCQ